MQTQGKIAPPEMYRAFNMGIGMIVVVRARDVASVLDECKRNRVKGCVIGEIVKGCREVVMDETS
jgi:phosphoribosylformylglycinamidine cyclo-ligase